MVFSALKQLSTDTVRHLAKPIKRDAFGQPLADDQQGTEYPAHVTRTPGSVLPEGSKQPAPNAAATIWMLGYPNPIELGDTFELSPGERLKVDRIERRQIGANVIHKVYLNG